MAPFESEGVGAKLEAMSITDGGIDVHLCPHPKCNID